MPRVIDPTKVVDKAKAMHAAQKAYDLAVAARAATQRELEAKYAIEHQKHRELIDLTAELRGEVNED